MYVEWVTMKKKKPDLPDEDPVVKYEWLALLDVAQGGHVKHHPVHVVGVAAHLGGGALGFYWSLVEFNWNCA